ncbi:hypothetical protein ACQ4PT_010156 [Festuca glaucescens]
MADFALGLTKTAVAGTLNRVKSAIEEETKLRVRVENDLVFITGEFQMMQSFLNVANAERAKNEVVRTWVRQIRDLAFDVEDCVEFIIHLDKRSVWSWFWRVVPSFMAPKHTRQLDQAVAEIKQLKARVEDVSQRNTRYNLISHSDSMVETPDLIKAITTDADTSLSAAFHILSEVQDASGKQQSTGDLRKLITSDASDLQVISVWGNSTGVAADLGAACIIRKAYDDPKIRQRFISRAWVKMMHPFNPDELLKSLLAQFYANSHQPNLGAEFSKKMKAAVSLENNELMHQVSEQSGASGKAILGELKKLTQLRKLAISGINHGNWQDMCCTISGHGYLVSLSVRLDDKQEDKGVTYSLGDILVPPKTLECLKLYGGNVHVSPVWMEQLSNLRKAHLELTISTQEEIDSLVKLPNRDMFRRLCVKPIQNGQLFYGLPEQNLLFGKGFAKAPVLKIDCSSCESVIVFGYCTPRYVEVIVVHCPTVGSSLELSGLERLHLLKEVRLQGFYSSTLKRHLEQKVAEHENKPVLKVDDQPTIQSPKSKCPALPACCGST